MNTPNTAELLVQQTEKATRLQVKLEAINRLVAEAKDLDELRREIDRLNQQQ